eukprot:gnl/Trimastix_PCT/2098.p1 GENE.gnl/Trimastix_PCT/2098~~gnl/Trimastix_PCT/2098.p1  ORF type:complete len:884 (-),score=265.28 gnl/Trimastix_PCT/2098:111-2762(-)
MGAGASARYSEPEPAPRRLNQQNFRDSETGSRRGSARIRPHHSASAHSRRSTTSGNSEHDNDSDTYSESTELSFTPQVVRTIRVLVDGNAIDVPSNISVLEACARAGSATNHFCFHPRLKPIGKCKACTTEIKLPGSTQLSKCCSCLTTVTPGMEIFTNTPVTRAIYAEYVHTMLQRRRERNMNFMDLAAAPELELACAEAHLIQVDDSSRATLLDLSNCVECSRCVHVCKEVQGIGCLTMPPEEEREFFRPVRTRTYAPLLDSDCIFCGQCTVFCPSRALTEYPHMHEVDQLLLRKDKIMVAAIAPAVRVAIGEEFGIEVPKVFEKKLVAALRALGFDYVFDVQFGADLTIVEESHELIERIKSNGALPMFTSCCPSWVVMVEKHYPDLIPHLSTCRSPQMMLASLVKEYFSRKIDKTRDDICFVPIMPCCAKKFEATRDEFNPSGNPDVDFVLTTRELAELMRTRRLTIDLPDSDFDSLLGQSTGSAALFGATGGVMEAALRTAYELCEGQPLEELQFTDLRGLTGRKEAQVTIGGRELRVCVVSGGANIRRMLDDVQTGRCQYDFIECMSCPGGCLGGGGQPRSMDVDILNKRIDLVYGLDERAAIRRSHENPEIKDLYADLLGAPNGELAHTLLHTHYGRREVVSLIPEPAAHSSRHTDHGSSVGTTTTSDTDRSAVQQRPVRDRSRDRNASHHHSEEGAARILVLYGSQTGSAKAVATRIAQQVRRQANARVDLMEMNRFPVDSLVEERFVILVTSTFWESFPENALEFWSMLSNGHYPRNFLRGVNYTVFGLGDSLFEHFDYAARKLDTRLHSLGGHRFLRLGEGDYQAPNQYHTALRPWLKDLAKYAKAQVAKHPQLGATAAVSGGSGDTDGRRHK